MLDIKFVRENPDLVDKSCESRQNAHWDRERFFELDEERRSVIAEVEKLQAERNAVSKQIGQLMREGKKDEAEAAKAQVAANKDRIAELDGRRGTRACPTARTTPTTPRFAAGAPRASSTLSPRRTGIWAPPPA